MKTLVVAAMREEIAPLARQLDRERVAMLISGVGARNASERLAARLERGDCARVLIVGVSGALTDDLDAAAPIVGREIVDAGGGDVPPPDAAWCAVAERSGARATTLVSSSRVLQTEAQKRAAAAVIPTALPVAVDLESAAFARAAAAAGLPFAVLRSVSDAVTEDLPIDFERFRDGRGGIRRIGIMGHVALRPWLVPELLRLRRRVRRCADGLVSIGVALVRAP